MKRSLVLAAVGLLYSVPGAIGDVGPGEVTAVSVLPGPGSVNVVNRGIPRDFAASLNTRFASMIAAPVRGMMGENHM